ncbi:MAG: type II CAAX prenyl endopeptidase Rce1 family protein [Planctomyces sp.]
MNDSDRSTSEMSPQQFLISAAIFEGILLAIAFIGGWFTGINPTAQLRWSVSDLLLGLMATLPMLAVLAVCMLSTLPALLQMRQLLKDMLGPVLLRCQLHDLLLLSLLAGICEEVFFRGFLFPWIASGNAFLGVMLSSLLFGLAHALTPGYAVFASFLGLYLTGLLAADATPNLLIPIVAHTLYDLIAFAALLLELRRR